MGVVHTLRLVDDNNRPCRLDVADGRIAVQFVLLLIDDVLGLSESIDIDNHNLNIRAGGKLPHIGQLCAVVYEIAARYIVIERGKMLLRRLQGFIHAFADCNAGDNDNKLGKAIQTV